MLAQAALLTVLLFQGRRGQECPDSTEDVVGLSGEPLYLRPSNIPKDTESFIWKMRPSSHQAHYMILTSNGLSKKNSSLVWNSLNDTFYLNYENATLHIKAAKPQDSGFYVVEFTDRNGKLCTMNFKVSIFDHAEKPRLHGQWKTLAEGKCEVSLYCLVTRDANVTYSWYRGSKLISTQRNFSYLEEQTDASGPYMYTCNVSNPVSWASHTINLTEACLSISLKYRFLPFFVIIIILFTLFLGALICLCVWKKRKQSQTPAMEILTVYEDIKGSQMRRHQEQMQEQKSPGEGSTIYSMIECQPPASIPQDSANTLYLVVQPSRKSVSKKNPSPSLNYTVYEEVGKRSSKAHNPARLSRKELENFDIYFPLS